MTIKKLPLWWGYLDDQGVIRLKPYTTDKVIQNTEQIPYCKGIFEPFPARDRLHAQKIIAAFLDAEQFHDKRGK